MRNCLVFVAALAFTVVLLQSCGGNQLPTSPVAAEECTIVISGAITGKALCYAVGGYDPTKNETGIGITMRSPTGSITTAAITVKVSGYLQNGTFSDANSTSYASTLMSGPATAPSVWVASAQPKQGTTTITVSNYTQVAVAPGSPNPNQPTAAGLPPAAGTTGYTIHGTAQATLVPQMGATGAVTMTAKF
jgi:hypothetical protein